VEKKITKLSAQLSLEAITLLDNPASRKRIVNTAIEALKKNRLNIKHFNFSQMAQFTEFVSDHAPNEITAFFNFIDVGLDSGFYKIESR